MWIWKCYICVLTWTCTQCLLFIWWVGVQSHSTLTLLHVCQMRHWAYRQNTGKSHLHRLGKAPVSSLLQLWPQQVLWQCSRDKTETHTAPDEIWSVLNASGSAESLISNSASDDVWGKLRPTDSLIVCVNSLKVTSSRFCACYLKYAPSLISFHHG